MDPGTYSYSLDNNRFYDRCTGSHNTIQIDSENSSEVWHIFRVGRRAYPFGTKVVENERFVTFEASHNGYRFLCGSPLHKRIVKWVKNIESLSIVDEVSGSGEHTVRGGWTLDPSWNCFEQKDGWRLVPENANFTVSISFSKGIRLTNREVSDPSQLWDQT